MQEKGHDDTKAVLERLQKGKMLDHPGVALHVKRALDTNDYGPLMKFLNSYPVIQAKAENNIAQEEFENALSPFRPYPSIKEASEYLSGPLKFGYVNSARSLFGIPWDRLCLPILCAGRTGSGKSILIKSLISQIVSKPQDFNILIPDSKKEYRHKCNDGNNLKVLSQDKIMINPLQVPSWSTPLKHAMAFAKTFVSENYLAGTSENLIINLLHQLYLQKGILDKGVQYPTLKDLYDLASKKLNSSKTHRYSELLHWLLNRLFPYTVSNCFNCTIGIPLEIFQRENIVLEIDSGFSDMAYSFIVAHITNQLYLYNKQHNIGNRICHWFIADESRRLFSAHRDVKVFGESILTEILTRSRAYGISFLLASQESASFNSVMRSLSFLKIAFPLSDCADLDFIKASFGLSEEQKSALFELPPYGTAVVRYGGYEKPFLLDVPFHEITHEVSDSELKDRMASFYSELDRQIKEVVPPTLADIKTESEVSGNIPPAPAALLFFLGSYPFTTISGLAKAAGFKSPSQSNKALDWLTRNSFVRIETYRTSRTKPSTYAVLMERALVYLDMKGIPGKGSFEHSLYQNLVFEKVSEDGYTAKIEGRMKGSNKLIDVIAASPDRKQIIAFEITLALSTIKPNIISDLNAGVTEVVVVCRTSEDVAKAVALIAEARFPEQINQRIRCEIIDAFFS